MTKEKSIRIIEFTDKKNKLRGLVWEIPCTGKKNRIQDAFGVLKTQVGVEKVTRVDEHDHAILGSTSGDKKVAKLYELN